MVLAQIRANHQHALQLRQRRNRGAQPADGLRRGELGVAKPVIDVVATQATHQRSRQVQLFERAVRADQGAYAVRAMVGLDLLQTSSNVFQRRLPIYCFPLATLLEHGACQALIAVQGFVGETVAVGNPAFVDVFIFQRHHAHDLIVLDLDDQVGTGRIVRADRLAARQLPVTGAVAKRFAGQRANRANVNHVAGQFGVHRHADKGLDLGVFAAVCHTEFHHSGDFLAEADTARAVNATIHLFHRD